MYFTYVFSAEATKLHLVYLCFFFFLSLIFLRIRKDEMNQDLRFPANLLPGGRGGPCPSAIDRLVLLTGVVFSPRG